MRHYSAPFGGGVYSDPPLKKDYELGTRTRLTVNLKVIIQHIECGGCKHKATKAPRKPASSDLLVAGFLGAFVALCLCVFVSTRLVLNVLNNYLLSSRHHR